MNWYIPMKPIKQTRIGSKGNCFEACIASILELKINDVPDLNAFEENCEWVPLLNKWLSRYDVCYIECNIERNDMDSFFKDRNFYYILIGKTSRSEDILHAVVGYNSKIVHDPHPNPLPIIPEPKLRLGIFIKSFNSTFRIFPYFLKPININTGT